MGKIRTKEELAKICDEARKKGKKIVTTNGAFDLFHYGHLKSLKFAKEQGDILIVGINSDASVKKYKSDKRPIIPEKERAKIVAAIEYVDYVSVYDEKTPIDLLEMLKPHVHVKGSEYENDIPEKEVVEEYSGKVVFIKRDKTDVSTSMIIDRILHSYR